MELFAQEQFDMLAVNVLHGVKQQLVQHGIIVHHTGG